MLPGSCDNNFKALLNWRYLTILLDTAITSTATAIATANINVIVIIPVIIMFF